MDVGKADKKVNSRLKRPSQIDHLGFKRDAVVFERCGTNATFGREDATIGGDVFDGRAFCKSREGPRIRSRKTSGAHRMKPELLQVQLRRGWLRLAKHDRYP